MNFIKTETFELAVYSKGDINAVKLALVLPGKLDTKDYVHMKNHVEYLADLGFLAISFDPPGTWESPGDISLYTMSNYEKAIHEVITYYGNKPTFLMGHSRGGSLAIIAGAANPHVFAYTSIMGSLSKGAFTQEENPEWEKNAVVISKRDLPPGGGPKVKEFKLPYNFLLDQKKYDLTENLLASQKPKLFFVGKYDTIVNPEKIRGAYQLYADPKELHELNYDHDYRQDKKMIDEVNLTVENFLRKYNLVS
jgi:pimeloyl-ACP methyl ester carboxylesterase